MLRKLSFGVLKHSSFSNRSIFLPASAEVQPSCSGLLFFHGLSKKKFCLPSLFSDQRGHYQFTKHPRFFLSPSTSVSLTFPAGSRDWEPGCWEPWLPLDKGAYGGLLHCELENHAQVSHSQGKLLSLMVQGTKHFW